MTSFRNDDHNPYGRASAWPKMPEAPFRLGGVPMAAQLTSAPSSTKPVTPEPTHQAEPLRVAPIAVRPVRAASRSLRLTPLIAAAAVGAGGMLALVLLFGLGVSHAPAPPPAQLTPSALAVGALVGQGGPTSVSTPSPLTAAAEPATTPAPPPRLATAVLGGRSTAPSRALAVAVEPDVNPVQPPAPPSTPVAPDPSVAVQSPAPRFIPPSAPDPSVPISTHVPDGT